jgi:hypothetical protein
VAYRARTVQQILTAIDSYTNDVTVLAPSAWDPKIRLEPPKSLPTLDSRFFFKRNFDILGNVEAN